MKFKRKNTAEATLVTEFAFISKLISIVEPNLENYHDRKTGEAFIIKLSDPIFNRQIKSKHVNFMVKGQITIRFLGAPLRIFTSYHFDLIFSPVVRLHCSR